MANERKHDKVTLVVLHFQEQTFSANKQLVKKDVDDKLVNVIAERTKRFYQY